MFKENQVYMTRDEMQRILERELGTSGEVKVVYLKGKEEQVEPLFKLVKVSWCDDNEAMKGEDYYNE